MKVLGIVAEYNPFHNGHLHHINQAKELTNSDFVVAVMSGSFTQSGNIAIYDKFTRANIAMQQGIDLVLELPTLYAPASANYFATGAIELLDQLKIVDCICFGSECGQIETLQDLVDTLWQHQEEIHSATQIALKTGVSYASAREIAISQFLTEDAIALLKAPNNILGIEYLNALHQSHSNIKPYTIKRKDSDFNEILLNHSVEGFTSATSIRSSIREHKTKLLERYVPTATYHVIQGMDPTFNDSLFPFLQYQLLTTSKDKLQNIFEMTEGLENKLISCITKAENYDDFIQQVKSKRYQMSKIKRLLVNVLLSLTKDTFAKHWSQKTTYAHVLACSEHGKQLLSAIAKHSSIPLITSLNPNVLETLPNDIQELLQMDITATNLHAVIHHKPIFRDFTNKLS